MPLKMMSQTLSDAKNRERRKNCGVENGGVECSDGEFRNLQKSNFLIMFLGT